MSMKQGDYAKANPGRYALCVVMREYNDEVSLEHFMQTARFIRNIGELVTSKIDAVNAGLTSLRAEEAGDINISLENKQYSINVGKRVWSSGISFHQFIPFLQELLPVKQGEFTREIKQQEVG